MWIRKEDYKLIRDKLRLLQERIENICQHKSVIQIFIDNKDSYRCKICGKEMYKDQIPKGSIVCEYECKEKK